MLHGLLFALRLLLRPLVTGYVLAILWSWFVVPLAASVGRPVGPLVLVHAYGIALIATLLTLQTPGAGELLRENQLRRSSPKEYRIADVARGVLSIVGNPLLVLGAGWLVKRFVFKF